MSTARGVGVETSDLDSVDGGFGVFTRRISSIILTKSGIFGLWSGILAAQAIPICSITTISSSMFGYLNNSTSNTSAATLKTESSGSQDKNNKIVFFEGCNLAFDLEDLLRASAEILGKGTFGMTYKAALEDATTVVVKRLKEVTVGKRDFEQQMEVVGKIKHENVDAVRAYYYSKEEKLIVYDYYQQGSVSALLHGMLNLFSYLIKLSSASLIFLNRQAYKLEMHQTSW